MEIKGDWLRHAKFALIPTTRPRRFSTPGPVTPYVPVALIQNWHRHHTRRSKQLDNARRLRFESGQMSAYDAPDMPGPSDDVRP